jgi:hypothetical protein
MPQNRSNEKPVFPATEIGFLALMNRCSSTMGFKGSVIISQQLQVLFFPN